MPASGNSLAAGWRTKHVCHESGSELSAETGHLSTRVRMRAGSLCRTFGTKYSARYSSAAWCANATVRCSGAG